jgi:phage terminase large subunit
MTDSAAFWNDYPNLDYVAVLAERTERLKRIRANPEKLPALREHYRRHPWIFVSDWCTTLDPREVAKGRAAVVPFIPWAKQLELIEWMYQRWRNGESGTIVKSRDVGASTCAMGLLVALCVLERNFAAGIVSATEVKLDRVGDPDTLLYKARIFLRHLPPEFNGGYVEARHSTYLRLIIPETGGTIVGETGDQAGRGGRKAIVVVDESAHLPHPRVTDAALAATSPCRIDMSSVNGIANSFYERAHNPNIARKDVTWRDDPRLGPEWYEEKRRTTDPLILAAEYDCDFSASTEGQLIPTPWINSAIGVADKLGIEVTGERRAGYDVADEGRDKCAVAIRHGIELVHLEAWPGKGGNIFKSTERAAGICERYRVATLVNDADGLGSAVRGDGEQLNAAREAAGKPALEFVPFRGSAAVYGPDESMVEGRLNRDHFQNAKAQCYWHLRGRFELTNRVVEAHERGEPIDYNAADLIAIDPGLPHLNSLVAELSQLRWVMTAAGKVLIDKQPDGTASPNLSDAVMIAFSPFRPGGYFASPPASSGEASAPRVKVQALPRHIDLVTATLTVLEDVGAVVYLGVDSGVWVLDYDIHLLDVSTELWIAGVFERLEELRELVGHPFTLIDGLYLDDYRQGYAELLRQRGVPTQPIAKELPPAAERFGQARPYWNVGYLSVAPTADRVVEFRGARRNFLREVLSATAPPETSALAQALATATLMSFHGRTGLPASRPAAELLEAAQPAPVSSAPEPLPPTGVHLRPGPHKINGVLVDVPSTPGLDLTFWPLPPGRYSIDDVQHWVKARVPGSPVPLPLEAQVLALLFGRG